MIERLEGKINDIFLEFSTVVQAKIMSDGLQHFSSFL